MTIWELIVGFYNFSTFLSYVHVVTWMKTYIQSRHNSNRYLGNEAASFPCNVPSMCCESLGTGYTFVQTLVHNELVIGSPTQRLSALGGVCRCAIETGDSPIPLPFCMLSQNRMSVDRLRLVIREERVVAAAELHLSIRSCQLTCQSLRWRKSTWMWSNTWNSRHACTKLQRNWLNYF